MQMSQALLILMSLFFLAVQVDVAVVLLHRLKQLDEKRPIVVGGGWAH